MLTSPLSVIGVLTIAIIGAIIGGMLAELSPRHRHEWTWDRATHRDVSGANSDLPVFGELIQHGRCQTCGKARTQVRKTWGKSWWVP